MISWFGKFRRNESANSFIALVMLLPLICGVFGTVMDFMYANYMRTSLQESLDKATFSTAREVTTNAKSRMGDTVDAEGLPGGRVLVGANISREGMSKMTTNFYKHSRDQHARNLVGPAAPVTNIHWTFGEQGRDHTYLVKSSVTEQSNTFFLGIIGIDHITYNLESTARLGYAVDAK